MNGENNGDNVFGLPEEKHEEMPVAPPPVIQPPKAEVPPGAEELGETRIEDPFYEVSLASKDQIAATHLGATPPQAAKLNNGKFIVRLAARPLKPETKVSVVAFPVKDGKLGGAMCGYDGSTGAFFRGSTDCLQRLLAACKGDKQGEDFIRAMAKKANVRETPSTIEDLMVVAGQEPRELRAFANKYKGYFQDLHDQQVASKAARAPQA